MSPVTHFLAGWAVANCAKIEKRDRLLVTVGGVIPDADGLGIILDFLMPRPGEPYFWFSELHHLMGHNLPFCLLYVVFVAAVAKRKALTALLAGLSFHLHLFCDLIGAMGPAGAHWPMPYFWPLSDGFRLDWDGMWALNAWPNIVITLALLGWAFFLAWKRGFSPLEMVSKKADEAFVKVLRSRFRPCVAGTQAA